MKNFKSIRTQDQSISEATDYHAAALAASEHAKKAPSATTHKTAAAAHEKAVDSHERKVNALIKKGGSSEELKKHEAHIKMHKNEAQKHRFVAHRLAKSQQNEGLEDACWKGYEAIGTKQKNGKTVPNCVPKEGAAEDAAAHHQAAHAALKKGDIDTYHKELDKKFDVRVAAEKEAQKKPVKTYESTEDVNLKITKHEKAAVDAGKAGDKYKQQWHLAKVAALKQKESVQESLDTDEFVDSYDAENDSDDNDSHEEQEIAMARGQLAEIADMANELVDAMDDTDELEPWMHSKVTTAYVNIDDIYSYIAYGDKYSTDDDSEGEDSQDVNEATEPSEGDIDIDSKTLTPEEKAQIARVQTLIRLGLIERSQMQITLRVIKKLNTNQPVTSTAERNAINDLVSKLIGVVTGDDTIFRKVKIAVQK